MARTLESSSRAPSSTPERRRDRAPSVDSNARDPGTASAGAIERLQGLVGNRAVAGALASSTGSRRWPPWASEAAQERPATILGPSHASEREADAAADVAMQALAGRGASRASIGAVGPVGPVMAKGEAGPRATPDGFASAVAGVRASGRGLASRVRAPFESAMGADFSGVRVHTDGAADRLSRSIRARAFTTGSDIFFRSGAYDPGSSGGQRLLAHELAHVEQQRRSRGGSVVQRVIIDHRVDGEDRDEKDGAHRSILRRRGRFTERAARVIGQNPTVQKKLDTLLHDLEHDVTHGPETAEKIAEIEAELNEVHHHVDRTHTRLRDQIEPDLAEIARVRARLDDLGERGAMIADLRRLRFNYLHSTKRYFSHADPTIEITEHNGVVSSVSTSSDRYFGNIHAIAYIEYLDGGTPKTIMAHIPGGARSYHLSPFDVHDVQNDADTLAKLARGRRKRAWERTKDQTLAAKAKADLVKQEGEQDGKYEYRREGTGLAFHPHREGTWGWKQRQVINCARYVEKILKAAGLPVEEVSAGTMFKTPQQVALGTTGGGDFKRWVKRGWSSVFG